MLLQLYLLVLYPILFILSAPTAIQAAPTLEYDTSNTAVVNTPNTPNFQTRSLATIGLDHLDNLKRATMSVTCKQGYKPQVALADGDENVMYCCPVGYTVVGMREKEGWVCCHDSLRKRECYIGNHDDFRGATTPLKCFVDGQLTDTVERERAHGFKVCQSLALSPRMLNRDHLFTDGDHDISDSSSFLKRREPDENSRRFEDIDIILKWWCSAHQDPRYCPDHPTDNTKVPNESNNEKRLAHNIHDTLFCINHPHHEDCQFPQSPSDWFDLFPPSNILSRDNSDDVKCSSGTTSQMVENSPGLKAYVCCPTDFPNAGWTTKAEIIPTCCKGNPDKPKLKGCPLANGGDRADSIDPEGCPGKFSLENRCGKDLCLWRSDWISEEFVKCP